MANETTKMGLIPVRKVGGQSWTGGQQRYRIASGATTAIFQGDLVTQLTAGTIGRHAASGTVPILGVFNGFPGLLKCHAQCNAHPFGFFVCQPLSCKF